MPVRINVGSGINYYYLTDNQLNLPFCPSFHFALAHHSGRSVLLPAFPVVLQSKYNKAIQQQVARVGVSTKVTLSLIPCF